MRDSLPIHPGSPKYVEGQLERDIDLLADGIARTVLLLEELKTVRSELKVIREFVDTLMREREKQPVPPYYPYPYSPPGPPPYYPPGQPYWTWTSGTVQGSTDPHTMLRNVRSP